MSFEEMKLVRLSDLVRQLREQRERWRCKPQRHCKPRTWTIALPKDTEVGDVLDVTIRGDRHQLELGYEEIELDGDGLYRILHVAVTGDAMVLALEGIEPGWHDFLEDELS